MWMKRITALLLTMMLMLAGASADMLDGLPMDSCQGGPAPQNQYYLSDTEYVDESISVKLYEGRHFDTDYIYAHVKISHPSQLRTAPATADGRGGSFARSSTINGKTLAKKVGAVIALNGDFYTKSEGKIVFRMGQQYRNDADGLRDLLIIDKNGDFSYLTTPYRDQYVDYYKAHKDEMYQAFCFGPVLVENGVSVIDDAYHNGYIGSDNNTQRSAIAQLGPLEYMLITCLGNQTKGNKGMTIKEFAEVCEMAGKSLTEEGCRLAFNLDGGNSSTMIFRQRNKKGGYLEYVKVNCPEIGRNLSDIIYFATLVK